MGDGKAPEASGSAPRSARGCWSRRDAPGKTQHRSCRGLSPPHVPSRGGGIPLPGSIPALSCPSFPSGNLPSHPQLWPVLRREGGGKGVPGPSSGAAFLRPLLQSLYPRGSPTSSPENPLVAGPPALEHRSERDSAPSPPPQKALNARARPPVPNPCHPDGSPFATALPRALSTFRGTRGSGLAPTLLSMARAYSLLFPQCRDCGALCLPRFWGARPVHSLCGAPPACPSAGMLAPGWRLGSGLGRWRVVISLRHLQPFLYKLIKENTGKKTKTNPARMG